MRFPESIVLDAYPSIPESAVTLIGRVGISDRFGRNGLNVPVILTAIRSGKLALFQPAAGASVEPRQG